MILTVTIVAFLIIVFIVSRMKFDEGIDYSLYNSNYTERERKLLVLINHYRETPLELDDFLSLKAEEHCLYCVTNKKASHDNMPERLSDITRGGSKSRIGEIVTYGLRDLDTLLKSLKNSEAHNNILKGNYSHVGISIKEVGKTKMYTTLIFGK